MKTDVYPEPHRIYPPSTAGTPRQLSLRTVTESIGKRGPSGVVFWTGAGISIAAPSRLPTGWQLTERVFAAFFEPDALAQTLGYHALSGWLTPAICDQAVLRGARPPRLETVLGVALRHYGTRAHPILDDVRHAPPNWNHRLFAAHLAAGGVHITANFDSCIENAYADAYGAPPPSARIEHFHGNLSRTSTVAELGATLQTIEGGFSDDYADRLAGLVASAPVTVLVGYSGSDFFDVDTAFARQRPGRLAGREVHWIVHSDRCEWHEVTSSPTEKPPLGAYLGSAGATVRYFCGATGSLLEALAATWGMEVPGLSEQPEPTRPTLVEPEGHERTAATLALFRALAIPAEVERILATIDADPGQNWPAWSELLWEQGRWSTLRRLWSAHRPPPGDHVAAVTRLERIGACLWAQGRLVPAYLWLRRHRRRLQPAGGTVGPAELAWPLAETEGRVIEHMARTPELRAIARVLARRAVTRLGQPSQRAGVHVYRRHQDLRTSLEAVAAGRERAGEEAEVSQRWFTEAGSLIGAVGYGHRMLRDFYDPARPREDVERAYRAHFRWASSVGSPAAAWRTILLPDADRVFSLREVAAGALALEYGHWQRIRILARSVVRRASWRLRRLRR